MFELAFSLNFHVPLSPEAKFNSQGEKLAATVPAEFGPAQRVICG